MLADKYQHSIFLEDCAGPAHPFPPKLHRVCFIDCGAIAQSTGEMCLHKTQHPSGLCAQHRRIAERIARDVIDSPVFSELFDTTEEYISSLCWTETMEEYTLSRYEREKERRGV